MDARSLLLRALLSIVCLAGCEGGIRPGDGDHEQEEDAVDVEDAGTDQDEGSDESDPSDESDESEPDDASVPGPDDGGEPPAQDASVVDAGDDEPPPRMDGPNEDRALFSGTHVFFTGADNRREIDADVELPPDQYQYSNIQLTLSLRCPGNGGCDHWDRHGHLSIVVDDGSERGREVEILRFVTPYRLELTTQLDVTELRPLLTGRVKARVFIDTWVGPGHAQGAGWLVDATLRFTGGTPARDVLGVLPLWSPHGVVYGDPGRPPARSMEVDIPARASGARLWSVVTGHGQGNAHNCAEFCSVQHTVSVGERTFNRTIWRDDCERTAVPNQPGTWQYPRAGWCPGAGVHPWIEEASVTPGSRVSVSWAPQGYENSCRPGVQSCTGCVFMTSCDYNGGSHTEPYYQLSALLVVYR